MCNSAVKDAVRAGTDVFTFGTAEVGGVSSKLGSTAANIISPPKPQAPPAPGSVPAYGVQGPPQQTGPAANSQGAAAAQAAAQKRAKALQAGIVGTLGNGFGLGGTGTTQSNAPNAFAVGMKQFTGQ